MSNKRPIQLIVSFLIDHPALIGAIVLILTSSVGYVYEKTLFGEFDINIFRFSSIYDFMYQWWRQWAVVHLFLESLLMMVSMSVGYLIALSIVGKCESAGSETGSQSLGKRILFGDKHPRIRSILVIFLALVLLVGISYLLAHTNTAADDKILLNVILVLFYGFIVFCTSWLCQHLIAEVRENSLWRWTGVVMLLIGMIYLFSTMLMRVHDIALSEARMLKLDTKYTYTVYRSDGDMTRVVSGDAKVLAVTTYYHLFYARESGKVIAIGNQYVGMLESNWLR